MAEPRATLFGVAELGHDGLKRERERVCVCGFDAGERVGCVGEKVDERVRRWVGEIRWATGPN